MSCVSKQKLALRLRRQKSVRRRVRGTSARPRLCVFRSDKHIYCQIIDDMAGVTLCTLSTLSKDIKALVSGKKPVEQARILGSELAKVCLSKSVDKVCFDRNGFIYHGRVAAVAAGAREGGLSF